MHRVSIHGGSSMPRQTVVVPNQPRTPNRAVRVPDSTWLPAQEAARRRGDTLSEIMRDSLDAYNIMSDEQWYELVEVAGSRGMSRPQLFSTAIIEWVQRAGRRRK